MPRCFDAAIGELYMKVLSVLLLCVLAACNSSAPPPPTPAASTIPDLTVFLVQGTPEQKSTDQVTYRKHDYPPPNGYQVDDSVLLPDGRILQTFSYPPFGPANFAKGDGGASANQDFAGCYFRAL